MGTGPIESAAPGRPLAHAALPYGSVDELLAVAVPFLRDGLRHGDATMVVMGTQNLERLRRALGPAGAATEFVDALDWYRLPARTLANSDRYLREHAERGRRFRLLGEPVWAGRSRLETTEWKRYESVLNVAFARSGAWLLCPYDTGSLDPSIVADALRTHPLVQFGGESRRSDEFVDPASFSAACDADPLPEPPRHVVAVDIGVMRDLGAVRRLVAEHARTAGLEPGRIPEVVLAVHEIASNAATHGSGKAQLRAWVEDGALLYQVNGSEPILTPFPGQLPPQLDAEHGRGLWLARQLAELLQVRTGSGGSVVRLRFPLPG